MTVPNAETPARLPCHICGYDLRAHPEEGKCPECGASVAEARRVAKIPRRPAWANSDPRWRRRMLAGVWMLAMLPLMDLLRFTGWISQIPVPQVFDYRGSVRVIDDTMMPNVFLPLMVCTGIVLLFSKERYRSRERFDWTRIWGVIGSYAVLLLSAAETLFIMALVWAAISNVFLSLPAEHQPGITGFLVWITTNWMTYGPDPGNTSVALLIAFSSITVLLACLPLFNALRSSMPRWVAAALLAPLALFSVIHLALIGGYAIGLTSMTLKDISAYECYFWPELLVNGVAARWTGVPIPALGAFFEEVIKYGIILTIALSLSIAQVSAWWQRRRDARGKTSQVLNMHLEERTI